MGELIGNNAMRDHWDEVFRARPDRFGSEPSESARVAARAFASLHVAYPEVLELGAGTGRDSLFFAERGMHVVALDFSAVALDELRSKAQSSGLSQSIRTIQHDIHERLPFPESNFHACYAHMLFCMDFTFAELLELSADIRQTLKPDGLLVYTARTTDDPDFGIGLHRGEQLYEDEGFVVHFFDRGMVERLAAGFRLVDVTEFEEGPLPRKLFTVTLQKL